ncbi:MAG: hypothetical protein ACI4II_08070 [Acutalibacteraceae bacterium]
MFDRETDLYRQSTESFLEINKRGLEYIIFPILDKMLLIATANSDISIDDFKIRYSDMWQELINEIKELKSTSNENKAECIAENLLNHSGICDNNTLKAIRPDLIGEYFVLKTLYKYKEKNATDLLFYDGWADNIILLRFFHMLHNDYHEYIYGEFKELGLLEKFLNGDPSNEVTAIIYSLLLANLSYWQELDGSIQTIAKLEELYTNYNRIVGVVVAYAKGLVGISFKQDLCNCEITIDKLKNLYDNPNSIDYVIIEYARGLLNLSFKQDLRNCEITIDKLKNLYNKPNSTDDVIISYTMGLVSLSFKQDLDGCIQTIAKLEKLYRDFNQIDDVIIAYTMGLVNLSNSYIKANNLKIAKEKFNEAEALCYRYPDNDKLIELFNDPAIQDLKSEIFETE